MKSLLKWVRSVAPTAEPAASTPEPEASETSTPFLYECHSCNSVYIAVEKQTCSSCKTPVERVSESGDDL